MKDKFELVISYIQLVLFLFILCLAFVAYFVVNVAVTALKWLYELVSRYVERWFC